MSDMAQRITRSKMSSRERHLRSQLTRLVGGVALIRGTPLVRERVCGKANCKCAKGEKHVSLYLVASEGGSPRQLFIPKSMESDVRLWVRDYQRVRKLLEEISHIYLDRIKQREV